MKYYNLYTGMDSGFQDRGLSEKKKNQKNLNTHPYSINKLLTKTNT